MDNCGDDFNLLHHTAMSPMQVAASGKKSKFEYFTAFRKAKLQGLHRQLVSQCYNPANCNGQEGQGSASHYALVNF